MRIVLARKGEPAELCLLGLDVPRAVERGEHVRDPDARGLRGPSDRSVDRAAEDTLADDPVRAPRLGPLQLGKAVYAAGLAFWTSNAEAPDSPASWTTGPK
jgi:hypothetical protein